MALYLVLESAPYSRRVKNSRFGAEYQISLLDHAGDAAYELPAEKGIFLPHYDAAAAAAAGDHIGCGYATFIGREELESSSHQVLRDDCLVIRCDVGVTELETRPIARKHSRSDHDDSSDSDSCSSSDESGSDGSPYRHRCHRHRRRRRRRPKLDDREYVRHCLDS